MKLSKIFNENKYIAKIFVFFFNSYHFLRRKFVNETKFTLQGDPIPKLFVPYHPNPESNLYGHIEVFKNFLGTDHNKLIDVHIQHGVIPGELVQEIMVDSFADTIITFSKNRKELLHRVTGKKVIAVGPYIRYVQNRLTLEEQAQLKDKFGKTLLVFPAHSSVDRTKVEFDRQILVQKIVELKNKYDIKTVFINLFYTDLNPSTINYYEGFGFKIVSAGYWLSDNFLPNLRTIIELSDYTMSNRMGTHIGYCLAMNKPHFIFKQNYNEYFVGKKGNEDKAQYDRFKDLYELDCERIESFFVNDDFIISDEQLKIVNEFWGNDVFYDKNELKTLLNIKI